MKARAHDFGLFISAAMALSLEGIGFTGQPAAYNEADEDSLAKCAKVMKSGDALAIAQLQHAGAAALTSLNGGVAYHASSTVTFLPASIPCISVRLSGRGRNST